MQSFMHTAWYATRTSSHIHVRQPPCLAHTDKTNRTYLSMFDTLPYNTQPPQPQFFHTNRHTAHTLQNQDSFTPLWISYSQSLCSCCLLTAWKYVPLLDFLLCARQNGLPPTFHFRCSYCLQPSLSTCGAVMLGKKRCLVEYLVSVAVGSA